MQTRTPTWRLILLPGLFVAACVGLTLFAWLSFGGSTPLQAKGYRIGVPLPQAPNLFPGADVRAAGVTIGHVVSVKRDGNAARTVVEIDHQYAPLHRGTRALLRSKTLLGEGYLQLSVGPVGAAAIADDGSLAASDVVPAQRLDDVLQTFRPATRARLRALASGLAAAFHNRGPQANDTLGSAPGAAAGLATVLGTLDRESPGLTRLIADSGTVVGALGRRQGSMQAAIRAADAILRTTAQRDRALAQTVHELPSFLDQLRSTSDSLAAANTDLAPAAAGLASVSSRVGDAVKTIDTAAPSFRRLFAQLPATLADADRGLPKLRRVLDATPPAFNEVYPTLREAIPVLRLLGQVRDSAITTFSGVGQIFNGTYIGPENRVLHQASGIITLWNESVGGWVRRLPSNRGNTYPKPGFLNKIGAGGFDSYDCRHINNPAVLPPFGSTPACRTQGPWLFEGKSRYYPHLEPAAP
jgi:virulence factor Mce-like protein